MMVDFYGDLSYCVFNSIFVICVKLLNQVKNRMLLWWSCSSQVTCVYGSRSLRKVKVKINVCCYCSDVSSDNIKLIWTKFNV